MTRPRLAFYGDDFTGSTDAMEVLQWSGIRTVLFLDPPSAEQLNSFPDLMAFGVAGWSRTMSPAEMDAELRPAFASLRDSGAAIVHYKTCSTFDSSPEIGSIGKALEIGREVFGPGIVPMVVGAPNLGRYQVFGNLFALSGLDTEPFRLDRHPTMRQHPITPMNEADLRLHLAAQTRLEIGLVDCRRLNRPWDEDALAAIKAKDYAALLFDVLYPEHLPRIGEAVQALVDHSHSRFVLGSSGIEYALTQYWSQSGRSESSAGQGDPRQTFGAADQLVVVTGSCSPVNDRQIAWAEQHGFEAIAIDTARLVDPATNEQETANSIERGLEGIRKGANIILHSSRGPNDPRIAKTTAAMQATGLTASEIKLHTGRILGPKLGKLLRGILQKHPVGRVGVAGGDTSGYIARELGITALEAIAPVAPGSPLCRAYGNDALDGVEFFFKGGQAGKADVWGTMRDGTQGETVRR